MSRISRDEWAMRMAEVTALRGTCVRRQVGCVLLDAAGVVLATGYNGVASGMPHCNEQRLVGVGYADGIDWTKPLDPQATRHRVTYPYACAGARSASGTDLDICEAIHAEQNALLQVADPRRVDACYVTVSPCVHCVKMLMNTSCRRIVFRRAYTVEAPSRDLWLRRPVRDLWLRRPVREWVELGS